MVVIALCVILGITLARAGELWQTAARREKERELLFVGGQFREAIRRYYENSPGVGQFPKDLSALLEDKRHPEVRRYLRRLYADPITGSSDWGIVGGPEGIRGVYSKAEGAPMKTAGFDAADAAFEGAGSYAVWKFVYDVPAAAAAQSGALPPGSGPATDLPVGNGAAGGTPVAPPLEAPAPVPPEDRKRSSPRECGDQRSQDIVTCNSKGNFVTNPRVRECTQSAQVRYLACLGGQPLPELTGP